MDLNKIFIKDGVYLSTRMSSGIFVCEATNADSIGKLVWYKYIDKNTYEKTTITYFLNWYEADSIKQVMVSRENFDMLGIIGQNYKKVGNIISQM